MVNRRSDASLDQAFAEFAARSGKFIMLLNGVSGLSEKFTMADLVAIEIAVDTTGYATRPAISLGSPATTGSAGTFKRVASQSLVVSATATMTFDGVALLYGATSARGNSTGNCELLVDDIGTQTITAGTSSNILIPYGRILRLS